MATARRLLPRVLIRLRRVLRNDQLVLAVLALAVGAAAGVGAIVFRWLIGAIQTVFYGFRSEAIVTLAEGLPWWQVLLAPAVGGLLIGLFMRFVMPGGRPLAVPHVMEAYARRGGRMSLRAGLGAAFASAASLGAGASVGREGPVVHLGATLGAWLARTLRLAPGLSRTLLGCGVAAAVAASFNAPIAGVFFALEVVVGNYALKAFAPIVLAGVMGTALGRLYYGNFPAFVLPERYAIASLLEFPAFALLGAVSALVAILFMKTVFTTEDLADRSGIPRLLRPAVGGLGVGAIAVFFPHVLGVGYEATDMALRGLLPFGLLLALVVAKTAATALSLGFGFGGGVFSPALFLGAMTGGAFGVIATGVFPDLSSGTGAYTLIGMGAVSGAVLGAPISTILIIFEMTGDYALTTALMVAVVVASTLVDQTFGHSFFTCQLARRGIDLGAGRETGLLSAMRVRDVMVPVAATVAPDTGREALHAMLRAAPDQALLVAGPGGRLIGILTAADLVLDDAGQTAADLARAAPPVIVADAPLADAVALIDRTGAAVVPVLDNARAGRAIGLVHERDVMRAYRQALLRVRVEEGGEVPRRRQRPRHASERHR